MFAGTPHLEALRILVALAAAGMRDTDPCCILTVDIKRAHVYAPSTRRVFVDLPAEDPKSADPSVCGELQFSMYGARDAAANWEQAYSDFLSSIKFEKGVASPCVFYSRAKGVRLLCHGDDFFAIGSRSKVEALQRDFERQYECTSSLMGPYPDLNKSVKFIGRIVEYQPDHISLRVDDRYVKEAIQAYGLDDATSVVTPAVKEVEESAEDRMTIMARRILGGGAEDREEDRDDDRSEGLGEHATKLFQAVAAS